LGEFSEFSFLSVFFCRRFFFVGELGEFFYAAAVFFFGFFHPSVTS